MMFRTEIHMKRKSTDNFLAIVQIQSYHIIRPMSEDRKYFLNCCNSNCYATFDVNYVFFYPESPGQISPMGDR